MFLVNAQQEPKGRKKDEAWLFQPELIVRSPDEAHIFIKRQLPPDVGADDPEDRTMQMMYRREVEFAVGHGVAVHADPLLDSPERATEARTCIIPRLRSRAHGTAHCRRYPAAGQSSLRHEAVGRDRDGRLWAGS